MGVFFGGWLYWPLLKHVTTTIEIREAVPVIGFIIAKAPWTMCCLLCSVNSQYAEPTKAIVLRGVPPRTWLGFMPPDGVKGFLVLHGFSSCAQWCSFVSRVVQDVQGVSTLSHVLEYLFGRCSTHVQLQHLQTHKNAAYNKHFWPRGSCGPP